MPTGDLVIVDPPYELTTPFTSNLGFVGEGALIAFARSTVSPGRSVRWLEVDAQLERFI